MRLVIDSVAIVMKQVAQADGEEVSGEHITATRGGDNAWTISGPIFPRHLRLLRDLDSEIQQINRDGQ